MGRGGSAYRGRGLTLAATALAGVSLATFVWWPAPVTHELKVAFAGCTAVLAGPVCEVEVPDELTLFWPRSETPELTLNGEVLSPKATSIDGGWQLVVGGLGPGKLEATVTASAGRHLFVLMLQSSRTEPAIRKALGQKAQGETDEAQATLQAALPRLDRRGQARASLELGRLQLAKGLFDDASRSFQASAGAARLSGSASVLVLAETSAAYVDTVFRGRFSEARESAERAERACSLDPSGCGFASDSRGLVSAQTGMLVEALGFYDRSLRQARRLQQVRLISAVRQNRSLVLLELGRFDEALNEYQDVVNEVQNAPACDRAHALLNLGWAGLLAQIRAGVQDPRATRALERSSVLYADDCRRPSLHATALLNQSIAALETGDFQSAAKFLKASQKTLPKRPSYLKVWDLDVAARVALNSGDFGVAKDKLHQLRSLGATLDNFDARIRAVLGLATLSEQQGQVRNGLNQLIQAEQLLDAAARAIPVMSGRESFVAAWDHSIERLIRLAVATGRPDIGFEMARKARARVLRSLAVDALLPSLDLDQRRRWDELVARYRDLRNDIEQDVALDWQRSEAELKTVTQERAGRLAAMRAQLDEVLAVLQVPLEPPEIVGDGLVVFGGRSAVWAIWQHEGRHDAGPLETILAAMASESSSPLRLLMLGKVDGEALSTRLLRRGPVVHAVDVAIKPSKSRSKRALVVFDPHDDLSAAVAEGKAVVQMLRAAGHELVVLRGQAATAAAVRRQLLSVDLVHYAGHGQYRPGDPFASSLSLAGGSSLTSAEILLLDRVPAQVVLSGCETGRSASLGASSLGLAQAFVARGAQAVVGVSEKVPDLTAQAFSARLYQRGAQVTAASVHQAQQQLETEGVLAWEAFRFIAP